MKNSKLKISSNLRNQWVYISLGVVSLMYVAGLSRQLFLSNGTQVNLIELLTIGVILAAIVWYVLRLRMDIKVTPKSIKVKSNQWLGRRVKIKWNKVKEIEPFHIPESLMWTGYSINFDHSVNQFRLGDNKGVKIELNSGETYLIYSNDLFESSDLLQTRVRKANG
jgi:hypothetical protein